MLTKIKHIENNVTRSVRQSIKITYSYEWETLILVFSKQIINEIQEKIEHIHFNSYIKFVLVGCKNAN